MLKLCGVELEGGKRLAESQVIIEYLEETFPERPLLPKDPYEERKAAQAALTR